MARVVSRSRPRPEGSTSMKFSEIIVMGLVIFMLAAGGRYYLNEQKSASHALYEYLSEVKAGSLSKQYALLDDQDKQNFFPTQHDYEQACQQARGYVERITSIDIDPDTSPPTATTTTLTAKVGIRDSGEGKELYQAGASNIYTDKYKMRKDKEGAWKVMLSKSGDQGNGILNLLKAKPNPPSMY